MKTEDVLDTLKLSLTQSEVQTMASALHLVIIIAEDPEAVLLLTYLIDEIDKQKLGGS